MKSTARQHDPQPESDSPAGGPPTLAARHDHEAEFHDLEPDFGDLPDVPSRPRPAVRGDRRNGQHKRNGQPPRDEQRTDAPRGARSRADRQAKIAAAI